MSFNFGVKYNSRLIYRVAQKVSHYQIIKKLC